MNKKILTGILLSALVCLFFIQPTSARPHEDEYKRLVLTLLAPSIQEQVNQFYKSKLTISPQFSPFLDGNDLEVKYHSSHIEVSVTLIPYVGPHLDVGMDSIKLRVDNAGKVEVVEFKHIKDYELPPNYKQIIIGHD